VIGFSTLALALVSLTWGGPAPTAPARQAPAEPVFGFTVQPSTAAAMLPHLKALGIRYVRAAWYYDEPPRHWAWLPSYRAAGIEVLPVVFANPVSHLRGEGSGRRMAEQYRRLVQAYGRFPYLQLDNEVDGDGPFGIPQGNPYRQGRRWGAEMREATRLIRTFDPGVKIVTGGLAWNREGVRDFTRGLVEVGGFDVLAIHLYGHHVYGEPLSRYRALHEAGWRGPIWATELGVSHGEARAVKADPDSWQLQNVRKVLTEDPSRHGYQRLYWFQLPPELPGRDPGWSMLRPDGRPRPAYEWLRRHRNP
jgi:hypothetical protein